MNSNYRNPLIIKIPEKIPEKINTSKSSWSPVRITKWTERKEEIPNFHSMPPENIIRPVPIKHDHFDTIRKYVNKRKFQSINRIPCKRSHSIT
jgi:hypothetical protein